MSLLKRIAKTVLYTLQDNASELAGYFVTPIISRAIINKLGFVPNKFLMQNLAIAKTVDGAIILGTQQQNTGAKFAIRKGLPTDEGIRVLAIENEPHELSGFSGEISSGYGRGTKTLIYNDKCILKIKDKSFVTDIEYHVHEADRAGKHFDLAIKNLPPQTKSFELNILRGTPDIRGRYAFLATDRGYIVQRMKDRSVLLPKPDMNLKHADFLEELDNSGRAGDFIAERKIDGSLVNGAIHNDRTIFRSHRETAQPYYDKIPQLEFIGNRSNIWLFRTLIPGPDLDNTIFQGEIVHPDGVSRVSGLLNAHADKSRKFQEQDSKAELYIWNVLSYRGKDISKLDYSIRREYAEKIVHDVRLFNKYWHLVDTKLPNESIGEFYQRIISDPRGLPFSEGLVLKHKTDNDVWYKVKDHDAIDAEILAVIPGREGTRLSLSMGAILVRDIKTGKTGEIGTGFSDALRQYIWDNKNQLLGSVIKAHVMQVTDKSLRAGRFIEFAPDPRNGNPIAQEIGLKFYAQALAGSVNEEEVNPVLYKLKTSKGWKRKS